MDQYRRVRRVRDLTHPLINAAAEALLLAAGFLDPEFEDDPLPGESWLRRLMYDGPPTWTFGDRWAVMMSPENVRLRNTPGFAPATGSVRSIGWAKGDPIMAKKATKSTPNTNVQPAAAPATIVAPSVEALAAQMAMIQATLATLAQGQTHPAALATVAAATAPSAKTIKRAEAEAARAAHAAVLATLPQVDRTQAKSGTFTVTLTKVRGTRNSVVYTETVNGAVVEDYAQGHLGTVHVRAETLAAAGKLGKATVRSGKRVSEVADGPETITVTVKLG